MTSRPPWPRSANRDTKFPAVGLIADGADAVEGLLNQLLAAFPDFWLKKDAVYHSDDVVVVEARFGGTHRGVWAGIAATERKSRWKYRAH